MLRMRDEATRKESVLVTTPINSCIVIGAGISGLLAARRLQEKGIAVTLIDKGQKVGGRMASRHVNDAVFDTGTQFFTVRDERFQRLLDEWQAAGVARQWGEGFASGDNRMRPDGHPRYRGVPYMRAIPEFLAQGLDIRTGERVDRVEYANAAWQVFVGSETHTADALVMTPPAPQSMVLLAGSGVALPAEAADALNAIEYDPCIALLAMLPRQSKLPQPGGLRMPADEILWMADNHVKGISPDAYAVTIHAGPGFSRQFFDTDDEMLKIQLVGAAAKYTGAEMEAVLIHRWRHSQPVRCHEEPCLKLDTPGPLAFAGDGFGAPRVEGAALSGLAAAEALLS